MTSSVTKAFRELLQQLPRLPRSRRRAYALWRTEPYHNSLQFKRVSRRQPIYSVRVGLGYRALSWREDDQVYWFWIGPHAEYDELLKRQFAENIDGAKQFLVDYIGNFQQGFLTSEFYNFPCFPQTVPDLKALLARDDKAKPPEKYKVLEDVLDWVTNVGYPGYANAAIDEIFSTWVISTMFAQAATGKLTQEEALTQADAEIQRIFQKWRERGKI